MLKKCVALLLILILALSFCACSNKANNKQNDNDANDVMDFCVDETFTKKLVLSVPSTLKDKYITKISSSFTDGYFKITVCLTDKKTDIFSVYYSKKDIPEDIKKQTGYKVLEKTKEYTLVWFEYDNSKADKKTKENIDIFKSEYKNIKSFLNIEKTDND